jgi:energy-coupling factor transporter ATP-binding protein EcfA2
LGHNGSGKSSLAKHINALLMPTEGSVWIDGIETTNEERVLDIRQTAGMVFQNPDNQIVATMVEEDVAFGPENMQVPTAEIWKRVERALGSVNMTRFRHKSPLKLSGGQKQRVAIAGIIAMRPKCIVLDEPTAMLDPKGRESVIKTIKELNRKEKITIVLITHYMEEIVDADYDHEAWRCQMSGMEQEPERGGRCLRCFKMRLLETARYAHEHGFSVITTTLASSRWKSLEQIEEAGRYATARYPDVTYWEQNWRKGGLSERRIAIIKEYDFYNQRYCGCEFSMRKEDAAPAADGDN